MLPGHALDNLLCSFSPAGDRFAIAGPDGRIRVFDTGNGRLLVTLGEHQGKANGGVANGHLVEANTCLAWLLVKEKSKKKQGVGALCLAVGTAAGDVKLYDVELAELKWRAVDAVQGGVKCLASSTEQGILLATGNNCSLVSMSISDGEIKSKFEASKYSISSIALTPDGKHVFGGGSSMQLWNLSEEERAAKYTGHPTEVRAVAFVPGQPHAVSAGRGERHVALWDVPPPAKKSKKQHPAVTTLHLEDPAVQLDAACVEGGTFTVAAVSEGGEAYVWVCHRESALIGADDKPGLACQLVMRLRVGDGTGKGSRAGKAEAVLGLRFQPGSPGQPTLLIAHGTSAKPAFETLPVPLEPPAAAASVVISLRQVGGVLLSAEDGTQRSGPAAGRAQDVGARPRPASAAAPAFTVVGADNIGRPVVTRAVAEAAATASASVGGRKRGAETDDPGAVEAAGAGAAPGSEAQEEEVSDLPEGEMPLGERVAALEARSRGEGGQAGEVAPGPRGAMPVGSSKVDSLSVLLTQAIRSNDKGLLERCLGTSSSQIINNTVARIVPLDAALFLKVTVDLLISKPNRAGQLVPWIRAVLYHHTAYLMSAPGVQPALASLFQAIDTRVKLHDPLLRLYGRLGLLLHHTRDKGQQLSAEQQRPAPEVVFEDDLEAEEPTEAEDPFAPALVSVTEDGDDDDDGGSSADDGDNDFDAMLADGPAGGKGDDGSGGDDDDDDDIDDLLDDGE